MAEFRKKPVVIQAMRLHAETSDETFLDPNTRAVPPRAATPPDTTGPDLAHRWRSE
jgi:hypothetical protein